MNSRNILFLVGAIFTAFGIVLKQTLVTFIIEDCSETKYVFSS